MREGKLLAAYAATLAVLLAASALLTPHPVIMGDETHYLLPAIFGYSLANFGRWEMLEQIPNHLFYALYGIAPPGYAFTTAKVLNSVFFAAAALPAFVTARLFIKPPHAAVFAAMAACIPMSTFTRHFMPESAFYFGFWCLAFLVVGTSGWPAWRRGLAIGAAAGVLALVKPHALALAVGISLFLLLRRRALTEKLAGAGMLALGFLVARVLAGLALTGNWETTLAGATYQRVLLTTGWDSAALAVNVGGHMASLVLLAGLPLVAIAWAALAKDVEEPIRELALLSACLMTVLVAITVYFSFAVYLINPAAHRIERLHGRYYAYVLPLAMLAYAALLGSGRLPRALGSWAALIVWAVAAVGCALVLARYEPNILVDYTDLGLVSRSLHGYSIAAFAIVACVLVAVWFKRPCFADGMWRQLMPLAWWAGIALSTSTLLAAAPITGHRFAADYIDRALTGNPAVEAIKGRSDGMIAAIPAMAAETYRAMFHLRSMAKARAVPAATLRAGELPEGTRWIILLPGVAYDGPGTREDLGGLVLVRVP